MFTEQLASDFIQGDLSSMKGDYRFSDAFCRFINNKLCETDWNY